MEEIYKIIEINQEKAVSLRKTLLNKCPYHNYINIFIIQYLGELEFDLDSLVELLKRLESLIHNLLEKTNNFSNNDSLLNIQGLSGEKERLQKQLEMMKKSRNTYSENNNKDENLNRTYYGGFLKGNSNYLKEGKKIKNNLYEKDNYPSYKSKNYSYRNYSDKEFSPEKNKEFNKISGNTKESNKRKIYKSPDILAPKLKFDYSEYLKENQDNYKNLPNNSSSKKENKFFTFKNKERTYEIDSNNNIHQFNKKNRNILKPNYIENFRKRGLPEKDINKLKRIKEITSQVFSNDSTLNELKKKFGDDIIDILLNGDISEENLTEIEKILTNRKSFPSITDIPYQNDSKKIRTNSNLDNTKEIKRQPYVEYPRGWYSVKEYFGKNGENSIEVDKKDEDYN